MAAWLSLIGFAIVLSIAVLLSGGVGDKQWFWIAFALAALALFYAAFARRTHSPSTDWPLAVIWLLLIGVVIAQIVPLPVVLVRAFSPERFRAVQDGSALLGMPRFTTLSQAPGTTLAHLTRLAAYASCFFLARSLAWRFRKTLWVMLGPVILIAFVDAIIGIAQVFALPQSAGAAIARGTYVNRNHFSGLLEMAMPLVLFSALALWRSSRGSAQSIAAAIGAGIALFAGALMLIAVIYSLSRAGFLSAVGSMLIAGILAIGFAGWKRGFAVVALFSAFCCVVIFLPTDRLIARLAPTFKEDLTSDGRTQIWRDSITLCRRYLLTGTGLGAFEVALYPVKTASPMSIVDYAHNDYLQFLAELGAVGAVLLCLLAVRTARVFRFVLTARRTSTWALALGLCASFAAIAMHSFTDFNLYIPANALTLAWLAGTAVSPAFR